MGGIERISKERQRQLDVERWMPEHDDEYACGELAKAASCYAAFASLLSKMHSEDLRAEVVKAAEIPAGWPWADKWWKPSLDPARNLEKASALIAAEIDRLERERAKVK